MSPLPFVSVIIPVYNHASLLRTCLDALSVQTYPRDRFEVIVVDNNSTDEVDAVAKQYRGVRLVRQEVPGSYASRNRGLEVARGDVLAFTDADCVPAADWLEHGVEHISESADVGLIAGRVEIFVKDAQRPTPVELYEQLHGFPQERYVQEEKFGATANLFTRVDVFQRVGVFDGGLHSGGDLEWGQRVHAHGLELRYQDDVRIGHPARATWAELYRKRVRVIRGLLRLRDRAGGSREFAIRMMLRNLVPPVRLVGRVIVDPRLPSAKLKLKYLAAIFFARAVTAVEYGRAAVRRHGHGA